MKIDWKKWLGIKTEAESQKPKAESLKAKTEKQKLKEKLPEGAKIKEIIIGPQQILKAIIYMVIVVSLVTTLREYLAQSQGDTVPLSKVIELIKNNQEKNVSVTDNDITITLKDGNRVLTAEKEPTISFTEILQKENIDIKNVPLKIENRQGWKTIGDIMTLLLTVGAPILLLVWFFRKSSAGSMGGGMCGFGKSTAKLFV